MGKVLHIKGLEQGEVGCGITLAQVRAACARLGLDRVVSEQPNKLYEGARGVEDPDTYVTTYDFLELDFSGHFGDGLQAIVLTVTDRRPHEIQMLFDAALEGNVPVLVYDFRGKEEPPIDISEPHQYFGGLSDGFRAHEEVYHDLIAKIRSCTNT